MTQKDAGQPDVNPSTKPDLGLYQAKYWLRNYLRKIPGIQNLSPNVLSLVAVVPGVLAALYLAEQQWLGALLSILGRMVVNTLDGLVAEEFNKKSHLGAYLNRLPGEFTDILIIIGLLPIAFHVNVLGWGLTLVVLVGWVQVLGILGLTAGAPTQSVGPCGQTDRLAIIGLGCIVALFGYPVWQWLIPALVYGCIVTILLRISRTIRATRALDKAQS